MLIGIEILIFELLCLIYDVMFYLTYFQTKYEQLGAVTSMPATSHREKVGPVTAYVMVKYME